MADTATAAVNPGCKPGAGTVSVGEGATLEVAQSGTATLGGALTLAAGAALAFSFTGADVKLVDAPRWADSVYVRNGDIVLRVRKGTAVFVR